MSTRTSGYSLRLRSRGNANSSADNDAGGSRTALGDVANVTGETEADDAAVPKETKPKKKKAATSTKTAASTRPRRDRGRSKTAREKEEVETSKPAAARASSKATKKDAGDKKATTKKGALKRENNSQAAVARQPKRSRNNIPVFEPRQTRSRSASRRLASKTEVVSRKHEAVKIITGDDEHIVPMDFRLQRGSFDGANFTNGIAHFDAAKRSDPQKVAEYITDLFQHLYKAEATYKVEPYMTRQEDINSRMRAILIDWLVEVHMKFRLVPETLYLCVSIIDRYCSKVDVLRSKLQLIGVTALLVACKHEEIYPPEVRDCVYITDRAYNRQEVLDMEQDILKVLDWKISIPTAYPFLDRFLSLTDASEMTTHAASYYLERTLQEHSFLQFRPSVVCASAVILALNNPDIRVQEEDLERELPGFPKILMEYTGFCEYELTTCMERMAEKVAEEPITASRRQLNAVKKKFENSKYLEVSVNLELPNIQYVLEANK
mmetsp:Transcript_8893/g.12738  ORF Transcript_8893/g.12738 Transcript_8893/m.12738 type:complete len:493 (-) Transcript_8893:259-1737(-)|eukprot:CAMPEP_0201694696 /NCGR_PEP_ID=MMETSP0578-20130828/6866_1 /ASSEMBLY_ACC=CAM_ASM_000663 /TAXON_ID=267565 /ORGANISM="Skeletonema grethea, Strain CCMP 1804" /LENGTH=492 /DNA_ID=CAMNT_0048180405 /DNA_START=244 /DNA_END=1722 /DNA_ORIENTATION=+